MKYQLSPKTAGEVFCKHIPELENCVEYAHSIIDNVIQTEVCNAMIVGLMNFGIWREEMLSMALSLEKHRGPSPAGDSTQAWRALNDIGDELAGLIENRLKSQFYNCQWPEGRR